MRNDDIRDRLTVRTSQRGAGKQYRGGLDTSRDDTKNTSEERFWRWYHLGEESEEDRIPKQRWMSCVNRDMRAIGKTKVQDRTGWRRIVCVAAIPQPSGSG